jgi:hypothetical protein
VAVFLYYYYIHMLMHTQLFKHDSLMALLHLILLWGTLIACVHVQFSIVLTEFLLS